MKRYPLTRQSLLSTLADYLCGISSPHPLRVAIDGIDTAGKTTMADELAQLLQQRDRSAIRASVDDFHNPRAIRSRRGALSPEGYYYDAFDYDTVIQSVLLPLGPTGERQYRTEAFDYRSDRSIPITLKSASSDALLIFDGVFLLRPELCSYWDVTIFLDIAFTVALKRALERDRALFGTEEVIRERYTLRYLPGQQLYLQQCQPQERADIVIDNTDPSYPILMLREERNHAPNALPVARPPHHSS